MLFRPDSPSRAPCFLRLIPVPVAASLHGLHFFGRTGGGLLQLDKRLKKTCGFRNALIFHTNLN